MNGYTDPSNGDIHTMLRSFLLTTLVVVLCIPADQTCAETISIDTFTPINECDGVTRDEIEDVGDAAAEITFSTHPYYGTTWLNIRSEADGMKIGVKIKYTIEDAAITFDRFTLNGSSSGDGGKCSSWKLFVRGVSGHGDSPVTLAETDPLIVLPGSYGQFGLQGLKDAQGELAEGVKYLELWVMEYEKGTTTGHSSIGFSGFSSSVTPIPEPGTFALTGIGLLSSLVYFWRRRRRKSGL